MIKIIEGLKPWEVMKRADDGEPVVYHPQSYSDSWNDGQPWAGILRHVSWDWNRFEYAIIDTSVPVINWDKFDWDFFNQYGGLQVIYRTYRNFIHDPTHSHLAESCLTQSPLYYWRGKGCPVPSNVEVTLICRNGTEGTGMASAYSWGHDDSFTDIIAFKLTGNVL